MPDSINSKVQPFVKVGEQLQYAKNLKAKGLWPPRLHNRVEKQENRNKPIATPFLLVKTTDADNGTRPVPTSRAHHSQSIILEDTMGNPVVSPVLGTEYILKCRVVNLGAFASYAGLADFYVNKPSELNAIAGMPGSLPAFGRTGFSVLPGRFVDIRCPRKWKPLVSNDLAMGIMVQVYDPLTDMWTVKFDARYDRHVGRHDFTADFYVRDWTSSAMVHDRGEEPSTNAVFYNTSDIWNRRSNAPGSFTNDQPDNQPPQAGPGTAGDNFAFSRIERKDAINKEKVRAHFLFAEFGTGSPYQNCSPAADPEVEFLPGETSKIISLPWHLPPSSSTHLCLGVQIYSDSDVYLAPGLLGNTPGWPTTDLMVINDNNKAQRNMQVWDGIQEEPGMLFALIFNSAVFLRDVELQVMASSDTLRRFKNAKIMVPETNNAMAFMESNTLKIPQMLPGERRWISFSYDSFSATTGEKQEILFNEIVQGKTVNGFSLVIKGAAVQNVIFSNLDFQSSVFFRMSEGMGIKSAKEGLAFCQQLSASRPDQKKYISTLQRLTQLLWNVVQEMSVAFGGLKDVFGVSENIKLLASIKEENFASKAAGLHQKLLNQLDAWQTMVINSQGDEAAILFTVRLQKEVYGREKLNSSSEFMGLMKATNEFINAYTLNKVTGKDYPSFVRGLVEYFKLTVKLTNSAIISALVKDLVNSLNGTAAGIQKAHLAYLNAVLQFIVSIPK